MLQQTATKVTGVPLVTLVDIDGFRVGVGEKDIPDIPPEPCLADAWPAWTDVVRVRCGRRAFDRHALQVLLGDAMDKVLDRIDAAAPDDEDLDVESGNPPLPEPEPLFDPTEPPYGSEVVDFHAAAANDYFTYIGSVFPDTTDTQVFFDHKEAAAVTFAFTG